MRLIRSKGVGVYFITQSPLDIPADVLGQLGTRVQHALRAFTPKDKKAVKTVAETFRPNPDLDTKQVITELGTGEALVSLLDDKGAPTPVQRILIRPPHSRIGPLSTDERNEAMQRSPLKGRYDETLDRESAYELLKKRAVDEQHRQLAEKADIEQQENLAKEEKKAKKEASSGSKRQGVGESMLKSAARAVGSSLGRRLIRGLLGSLLGGK